MTREELIKQCKYYKGENIKVPASKYPYAKIERLWVNANLSDNDDMLTSCFTEYVRLGLTHFSEDDGVSISLKSFLANRFFQYTERIDVNAFKDFYADYIKSQ